MKGRISAADYYPIGKRREKESVRKRKQNRVFELIRRPAAPTLGN